MPVCLGRGIPTFAFISNKTQRSPTSRINLRGDLGMMLISVRKILGFKTRTEGWPILLVGPTVGPSNGQVRH